MRGDDEEKDGPILGLHIEGPYLNPKMAASLFIDKENPADPKEYKEILERTDCIKRWDSSPEIPGALEVRPILEVEGNPIRYLAYGSGV